LVVSSSLGTWQDTPPIGAKEVSDTNNVENVSNLNSINSYKELIEFL